jgi:hypothetical protein
MDWMKLTATLGTWAIAVLGLVWAIVSYRLNSRNSLALERTKFIFEHLKYFDIQPSMQTANKIVYGLIPDFTIERFLDVMKTGKGTPDELSNCMAVENYLNFLWRIGYAHFTLETISVDDLDAFGYYFYTVSKNPALSDYCIKEGFEEVIQVALKLKPIWDESDRQNVSLRAKYEKMFTESRAVSSNGAPSSSTP